MLMWLGVYVSLVLYKGQDRRTSRREEFSVIEQLQATLLIGVIVILWQSLYGGDTDQERRIY
jgi:hypothetical protein